MSSPAGRHGCEVAAIVLAAGRSSRMGPHNKLLQPIDGSTIIARVAGAAIASGADPVIVVTGFEADRVEEALWGLDVTFANNPNFDEGMSGSIKAGLSALPASSDGAMILLGDMPEVEARDLRLLMGAFAGEGGDLHSGARREAWQSRVVGRVVLRRDDGPQRRCRGEAAHREAL